MTPTVKDIANECGVSTATVSRILSGKSQNHLPDTANLIRETAKKMGYRSNASARAVRTKKFNSVSMLLGGGFNIPFQMLRGIQKEMDKHDAQIITTYMFTETQLDSEKLPKSLRETMSDGFIIVNSWGISENLIEEIQKGKFPTVWINYDFPENCVMPDDEDSMRRAIAELRKLGHKKIGYADYTVSEHYSSRSRYLTYIEEMGKNSLPASANRWKMPRSERIAHAKEWLKRENFTAILTYGDSTAYPIINAARELNIKAPDDLSIVTFGGNDITGIQLSHMDIPHYETGKTAAEKLFQIIKGPEKSFKSIKIKGKFIKGDTVAPPMRTQGKSK